MEKIIEFKIDNLCIDFFSMCISELSKWYNEERNYIESLYKEMLESKDFSKSFEIINIQNDMMINLIKKVTELLGIEKKGVSVYISNSYARGTNLLDSDIDINFVYEDKSLKRYEDLVGFMLSLITGKYRDFVHDSVAHRFVSKELSEEDELKVVINFRGGSLEHTITKGNIGLMDSLYRTHNNLEDFIKFYIERINEDEINEWVYFQKPICGNNQVLDYIKSLENNIRNENIDTYRDTLRDNIDKLKDDMNQEFNDISKIKKSFKNQAFKVIYEYLILIGKVHNASFYFKDVSELLDDIDETLANKIRDYFGEIMSLNYICDQYGVEFRTRYSTLIDNDFLEFYKDKRGCELIDNLKQSLLTLLDLLEKALDKENIMDRDVTFEHMEHINIANYSPLSNINNVSKEYQDGYFLLPFIEYAKELIPIHPDTISDLGINPKEILKYECVYPTSSTRTVYNKDTNTCYKLAVLRQITRSIRDIKHKEILRSRIARDYLIKHPYPTFHIIPEETHYYDKEIYNYIVRYMPNKKIYPWFYLIASNRFDKAFMMNVIAKIIDIWFFYASKGIYFESFHTQNLLVDDDGNLYYRDLSDIRIIEEELMRPSYINELNSRAELHSIFFDRSVLSQNLEHFINYCPNITQKDIDLIKEMIFNASEKYGVELPNYSMNYDKNRKGHHPVKVKLVRLREM